MMLLFAAICASFITIVGNLSSDFAKECSSKTGIAHQIDQIYLQGRNVLCSSDCPCSISDVTPYALLNNDVNF